MWLGICLLLGAANALHPSLSRLSLALDALDRTPKDSPRRVVDACLDVIRHVPGAAHVDKARLRALAEEDDAALSTRFFAARPCDDAARALARGDDEAAAAVAASGRFALLPRADADAALDALDAAVASEATLAARRAALDGTRRDGLTDAPSASDDERLASALASTLASALAPVLRPLGFPESPLGTRSFVAAAGPRAAAALGRVWHASDGPAPLFAPAASGDTLVVAFSSLG